MGHYTTRSAQFRSIGTSPSVGEMFNSISLSSQAGCGIRSSGELWCWGNNNRTGAGSSQSFSPVQSSDGNTWTKVSAGRTETCAIRSDGTLWCFGGSKTEIAGGGSWSDIDLDSEYHGSINACGIKSDGTLWCWGDNSSGELGDGTTTDSASPVSVSGGGNWIDVSAGKNHTCGIKSDGSAWCWGDAGSWGSALGQGVIADSLVPVAVSGGHSWSQIETGDNMSCGLRTDGTLWCWGRGHTLSALRSDVPVAMASGSTWIDISVGDSTVCGVRSDGNLLCIGSGYWMWDGTTISHDTMFDVSGGRSWQAVDVMSLDGIMAISQ